MVKIWTVAEMDTLRQRYSSEPNAALAVTFQTNADVVRNKAHALGLKKDGRVNYQHPRAKQWTADEDACIRREWSLVSARVKGHTTFWLAKHLGVTRPQLQHRAAVLGLRRLRQKEQPWSEEELELLDQWLHLPPPNIRARLARRGYQRSEGAITVARYRQFGGLQNVSNSYSAHQLSQLLGTSPIPVLGWIKKGWLKATPRGDSVAAHGGPGDRWMISPKEVKRFITENPSLVGPHVDRLWLIDLLTNPSIATGTKPAQDALQATQPGEGLPKTVPPVKSPEIAA